LVKSPPEVFNELIFPRLGLKSDKVLVGPQHGVDVGIVEIGDKVVWMQEGVINEAAAARPREAGLLVVMDKCMLKEHQRIRNSWNKR